MAKRPSKKLIQRITDLANRKSDEMSVDLMELSHDKAAMGAYLANILAIVAAGLIRLGSEHLIDHALDDAYAEVAQRKSLDEAINDG